MKNEMAIYDQMVSNDGSQSINQSYFKKIYGVLLCKNSRISLFFRKLKKEFVMQVRDLFISQELTGDANIMDLNLHRSSSFTALDYKITQVFIEVLEKHLQS